MIFTARVAVHSGTNSDNISENTKKNIFLRETVVRRSSFSNQRFQKSKMSAVNLCHNIQNDYFKNKDKEV